MEIVFWLLTSFWYDIFYEHILIRRSIVRQGREIMGNSTQRKFEPIIKFYNKYKHIIPLIVYGIIYMSWFAHLEETVTSHYKVIHVALDDHIPFCEVFVVPYLLWFAYVAAVVLYFFFKDKDDYFRTCTFLFTGMTVFLIISTVYPNGHYLRPLYFSHHNVFTTLCGYLYSADTATNLFPSIHVYNSIGIHLMVVNSNELKHKKTVQIVSFILCVSIILSTMFIKQHSVFDVSTAIILGFVMNHLIYVRDWGKVSAKSMLPQHWLYTSH